MCKGEETGMNGKWNKYKRKYNVRRQKKEKPRDEKPTNATLPIHDNVVIVCDGKKNDGKKLGVFFTIIFPRHPVFPHRLVRRINEVVEPTISLEILTHVFKVGGVDIYARAPWWKICESARNVNDRIKNIELLGKKDKNKKWWGYKGTTNSEGLVGNWRLRLYISNMSLAISVCPTVNWSRHIKINGVCKDKNVVVMEVGVCEGKQNLKICGKSFIPLRNIWRWGRDARHMEVLTHICKE